MHVDCWIVRVLSVTLWPVSKETLPGVKSENQEGKTDFIAIVASYL